MTRWSLWDSRLSIILLCWTRCILCVLLHEVSRRAGSYHAADEGVHDVLTRSASRIPSLPWRRPAFAKAQLEWCGRSVFCQRARLLSWRRRRVWLPWRCPHGRRGSGQSTGRSGKRRARWRRDTRRESERRNNEEQTLNRSSWMAWIWSDARMQTLEPWLVLSHEASMHIIRRVQCAWEKWRVKCICLHSLVSYSGSPSTVKETNCNKKRGHFKQILWAPPTPVGRVPPWMAWRRVPSPKLLWRNWFCNFLTWFTMKTVFERDCSSKSRIGASLPDLFKVRYQCPWYLLNSSVERWYMLFLFCQFVHLFALLFCPSDCELWFTIDLVSEKSIVNTCEMFTLRVNFFQHLFSAFQAKKYSFCSSDLPFPAPRQRPFLIT